MIDVSLLSVCRRDRKAEKAWFDSFALGFRYGRHFMSELALVVSGGLVQVLENRDGIGAVSRKGQNF